MVVGIEHFFIKPLVKNHAALFEEIFCGFLVKGHHTKFPPQKSLHFGVSAASGDLWEICVVTCSWVVNHCTIMEILYVTNTVCGCSTSKGFLPFSP